MALTYSENPENISSENNSPIFQDWEPVNNITNYYWTSAFPVTITYVPIIFKIKDVIGNPLYSQYTQFRLQKTNNHEPGTTYAWMYSTPPNLSVENANLLSPIPNNGLNFSFTPNFGISSLYMMPVGVKTYYVRYTIEGQLANGNWEVVSTYEHQVRLTIANQLATYSPNSLTFHHTKNTALPSENFNVDGIDWKVEVPSTINLSSATPGVTFGTSSGKNFATGSGPAVISCELGAYYDSVSVAAGVYNEQLKVYAGTTLLGTVPISITIVSLASFYSTPNALNFYGIKGIQEPSQKLLFLFCSSAPFTIEMSPWLTIVLIGANSAGTANDYKVKPIPTSNMEAGTYTGFIKFKDTVSGTDIEVTVPVTYQLDGFVSSPYENNKPAYTLDPKFFTFSTTNNNTYMQLTTTVLAFDFFTDEEKVHSISEKLPLFQGKGKINVGLTVHKLMNKFSSVNENLLQYKPALLSMLVEEINIETGVKIREALLQDKKFVAGLSNDIITDFAFLEFNKKAIRVTKNSIYIMNCIVPDNEEYELQIQKNDAAPTTIYLGFAEAHIISKRISFENYIQGDVITVKLNVVGGDDENAPSKTFYVLPEQKYSWNIFWENEFLLQSVLECTGGLSSKSDLEFKVNNVFQNLVEVLEIIETTKVNKITVNTGWILSTQIDDIESLMTTKKAWIDLGAKRVALRPISKTKIDIDTDRDLIDFSIEFQINRNYDKETFA